MTTSPAPKLQPGGLLFIYAGLTLAAALLVQALALPSLALVALLPVCLWSAFVYPRRVTYGLLLIFTIISLLVNWLGPTGEPVNITRLVGGLALAVVLLELIYAQLAQRRALQQSLADAVARLGLIVDNVNDAILVETPDGAILDANPKACEMYGLPKTELCSRRVADLVPASENLSPILDDLPDHPVETLNQRANGEIFPVELTLRSYQTGSQTLLLVVVRDISIRKQNEALIIIQNKLAYEMLIAESAEAGANQILNAALQLAGVEVGAVYIVRRHQIPLKKVAFRDKQTNSAGMPAELPVLGTPASLIQQGLPVYFAGSDDMPDAYKAMRASLEVRATAVIPIATGGHLAGICILGSRSLDDFPEALRSWLETIAYQAGSVLVRLEAQEQLRASETRFRTTFESATIGIFQTTLEGELLSANPATVSILGYLNEAALRASIGTDVSQLYVDPDDRRRLIEQIRTSDTARRMEIRMRRADGSTIICVLGMWAVRAENGDLLYLEGFLEDVTERSRLIRRLEQLNQTARAILDADDPSVLLPELLYKLHTEIPYDRLEIWTWTPAPPEKPVPASPIRREIFVLGEDGILETVVEVLNPESDGVLEMPACAGYAQSCLERLAEETNPGPFELSWLAEGFALCLSAPITTRHMVSHTHAGVLLALNRQPDGFGPSEQILVEQFTGLLSLGFQDSSLRASLSLARHQAEQRAEQIDRLRAFAEGLNEAATAAVVSEIALESVLAIADVDLGWIALYNQTTEALEIVNAHSRGESTPNNTTLSEINRYLQTQQVQCDCTHELLVGSYERPLLRSCTPLAGLPQSSQADHQHLLLPVYSSRRLLGVINLSWPGVSGLDAGLEQVLTAAAAQFGVALERALLFEQVSEMAIRDPLTDLYNRRYFFDRADYEFRRARRYNKPLALLMLDLDHFRRVNELHGHPVGDVVLHGLAVRLLLSMRNTDLLARYGGEEFVVLLPETNLEQAALAGRRIQEIIRSQPFEAGELLVPLTISLGAASLDDTCQDISELIERADLALYQAKNAGRNCVKLWQPETAIPGD